MLFIRRLVGHAHGEKRDDRGKQVKTGVQRLRKYAQASRPDDQKRLEGDQHQSRAHAQERGPLLLPSFLDLVDRRHRPPRLPQIQVRSLAQEKAHFRRACIRERIGIRSQGILRELAFSRDKEQRRRVHDFIHGGDS
jgi:hypothetical protein